MNKRIFSLFLTICLVFSLASAVFAAEQTVTVTAAGTQNYTEAQTVAGEVNAQRAANGLEPLQHNRTLCALAMRRAAEIALHYDPHHLRPDGSECFTIVRSVYEGYTTLGENIAAGHVDAADVMDAWMNSEGHRSNILNQAFTQIGVGCFEANGVRTWVQIFGNSASDTTPIEDTGVSHVQTPIVTLRSNLDVRPAELPALTLEPGEQSAFYLRNQNTYVSFVMLNLVPEAEAVRDSFGNLIASVSVGYDGCVTVEAVAPGSGTARISLYEGDPEPALLRVTVTDPAEPEPSEPEPTEPETTEPETTEPETTEPEITEPEITEPEITEPEITEPDPTDPSVPPYEPELYPVYVTCTAGGTAEVLVREAAAGDIVTLRIFPDSGWAIDSVGLYSLSDDPVTTYWVEDDNTICFVMPDGAVSVEVEFRSLTAAFVDLDPDEYYMDAVRWALDYGITKGMDTTHFGPNKICRREHVVTFLWRTCGEPEPQGSYNPFCDVPDQEYYRTSVLWAVEEGITTGMDATHFGPKKPCTRAQVVTFLWRTAGQPQPAGSDHPFVDLDPDEYYMDAVLWAVENGITNGMDATHFGPNKPCTRAQVVTFLYRTVNP